MTNFTEINLLQAYELEQLKSLLLQDDEIVSIFRKGDLSILRERFSAYDFEETNALFKGGEHSFLSALHGNYQIKYITLPGLQRLLQLRFKLLEEKDYNVYETSIENIKCSEETIGIFSKILSSNWKIHKNQDSTFSIRSSS